MAGSATTSTISMRPAIAPRNAPNEGIDTVNTWMSYRLPDNIENLIVTGDKRFAFGNNLDDNIITGGSGQQTLDGGRGDDVLKGGAGSDIFVVTAGNGSDLILDFGSQDSVRLGGYGFTSFADVRAHMGQSGANVRLDSQCQRGAGLRQHDHRQIRRQPVQAGPRQIRADAVVLRRISTRSIFVTATAAPGIPISGGAPPTAAR